MNRVIDDDESLSQFVIWFQPVKIWVPAARSHRYSDSLLCA
jgi:hypothetical protein